MYHRVSCKFCLNEILGFLKRSLITQKKLHGGLKSVSKFVHNFGCHFELGHGKMILSTLFVLSINDL